MSPDEPSLSSRIESATRSADRITAEAAARLDGTDMAQRSPSDTVVYGLGARAEDLSMILRRESQRAAAGVDEGQFRPALMRFAIEFFTSALTLGAEVGMTTDGWDLAWLADSDYQSAEQVEQERQAALAEIEEARAKVTALLQQGEAVSETINAQAQEATGTKLWNRLGRSDR